MHIHLSQTWSMNNDRFAVPCPMPYLFKIVSIFWGQIIVWGCKKIVLNDNVHWPTHYISMMCWSIILTSWIFYNMFEVRKWSRPKTIFFFLREEEAIKLDGLNVAQMKELREKAEKHVFQAEVNRMMKLIINSLYKNKEVKSILKEDNSRITNLRP